MAPFLCVFFSLQGDSFNLHNSYAKVEDLVRKGNLKLQPTKTAGTAIRSAIKTFLRQPSVVKTRQASFWFVVKRDTWD